MKSTAILLPISFVFLLLFVAGCGEYSPYKVVFVSGTLTVDDAPMADVIITFSPVNPNEGHAASGVTDAQGKFTMTTGGLKIGKGAVPGKYNVLISKSTNEGFGLSQEEYYKRFSTSSPKIIYHIPTKYSLAATSGIEPVTVEKRGKNDFAFKVSTEGLDKDNAHLEQKERPHAKGANKLR